jgi:hypothetical protein
MTDTEAQIRHHIAEAERYERMVARGLMVQESRSYAIHHRKMASDLKAKA